MKAVALVDDLMDRSKISNALDGVTFVRGVEGCAGADLVVVDLSRHAGTVAGARRAAGSARIVAYGRHDAVDVLEQARRDGADAVLTRARFFSDPRAAALT